MKGLRLLSCAVLGAVLSFGAAVSLTGCGDDTSTGPVKESVESKKENDRTTEAMKNAMQQKPTKGAKGTSK